MRVTRYLWITNLPSNTSEGDVRELLQSYGKIQSVRIHPDGSSFGAVVAFMDTKSATRAIGSAIYLDQTRLSLHYCESCGIPTSVCQEVTRCSPDTPKNNSLFNSDQSMDHTVADDSSVSEDSDRNRSHIRVHSSLSPTDSLNCSPEKGFLKCRSNEQRGLHIRHLSLRSSDTNLRDGLFHEYKKHGKITSVVIQGHGEDRFGLITFKRPEDAERAFDLSRGKVFFGTQVCVSLHDGIDSEDPDLCPPEHALDEYHPKATKTLFVGNLSSDSITQESLHKVFRVYGEIIEIDIKVQTNQPGTSYAFVQFSDIKSVVRALDDQNNIRFDGKCVKLGFGKSQPTNVAWLDNLAPAVNETFLTRLFGRYGHLTHVVFDRRELQALLYFDTVEMAQRALNETRNRAILGRKVQLDFAGYECQVEFMRRLSHSDGITEALATYKERLQELFTTWPSYNVPTERRRFSRDNRDNVNCDETKNSSTRSSRRFQLSSYPSTSLQSGLRSRGNSSRHSSVGKSHTSKRNSDGNKDASGDRYKLRRSSASIERSKSPFFRKSRGRLVTSSYSSIRKTSRSDFHSFDYTESRSHRYPLPSSDVKHYESHVCVNNENKSAQLARQNKSHYLDETDEVSSGSLSDLDASDDGSEYSSLEFHSSSQCADINEKTTLADSRFLPRSDQSRHKDSKYTTLPKCSNNPTYRHRDHQSSSVEFPKTSTAFRMTYTQPKSLKSNHQSISSHDVLRPRHSSIRDKPMDLKCKTNNDERHQRHDQSTKLVNNVSEGSEAEFSSNPKDLSSRHLCYPRSRACRSSRHVTPIESVPVVKQTRDCSDDRTPRLISSSQSHDALTKLEQERAKLLRELSILNNEVVNGNKMRSTRDSPKNSNPEVSLESAIQTMKREAPNQMSVSTVDSAIFSKTSLITVASGVDQSVAFSKRFMFSADDDAKLQGSNTHSSTNNSVAMFSPATAKLDSPLHSGFLNTYVPGRNLHVATPNVSVSRSVVESTYCSTAKTFTPTVIVPPEPNSPLSCLSPSGSPFRNIESSTFDVKQHFSVQDSCFSIKNNDVRPHSFKTENFPTRDPRLSVHYTNETLDVPPPPPENLKLPLWVDTSASTVSSSLRNPPSVVPRPLEPDALCEKFGRRLSNDIDSEFNAQADPTTRSLEERIRLLDVQLMKSEKVRPVIDYSKFRIRRKTDTTAPGISSMNSTAHPNNISSVSALTTDVTPSSPITTIQGLQIEHMPAHETSMSTPTLSVTNAVSNSPASVFSNSPLTLSRPADTSEFVKSMLSSKPTAPSCQNLTLLNSTLVAARSSVLVCGTSPLNSPVQPPTSDCAVQEMPMCDVADAHGSMIQKNFGSLGSRFLPSVLSNGGLQPVGVATRLPVQSSPFDTSSVLRGCSEVDGSALKPILKKDHEGCIVSNESVNTITSLTEVSKRVDVLNRSMAFTDTKRNSSVAPVLCTKPTSTFSSGHSDAQKTTRTKSLVSNALDVLETKFGDIKPQKIDSGRSNSVLSSFDPVFSKTISKERSIVTKKLTQRPKETFKPQLKCETTDIKVAAPKQPNIREQILATRTPIFEKHGFILSGKSRSQNSPISNNVPDVDLDGRKSASVPSKAPRLSNSKRKKTVKSVNSLTYSDSTVDFMNMSKQQSTDITELHYESMYDKIKRRASKGNTADTDSSKLRSVKRKAVVSVTSNTKKVERRSQLVPDSETDECYSESSTSNPEVLKSTCGAKAPKLRPKSPEIPSNARKQSKVIDFSDTLGNKKRGTFSAVRGRKPKKGSGSGNHVPPSSDQTKLKARKRKSSTAASNPTTSMRDLGNSISCAKATGKRKHCNLARSNFAEARGVSKRKRLEPNPRPRSLVHRVFASTDSDTPSSLSSTDDDSLKNGAKPVKKSQMNESEQTGDVTDISLTQVSHCSRSCSPEDLGVDDVARHTFGVFSTPFNASKKEASNASISSPTNLRQARFPSGSSINTSRATPSTLPMCESGSSAGRVSDHSIETTTQENTGWNLFASFEKQSTPKRHSPLIDQNKSPEFTYCECRRSVPETEDDLPSLEKHDVDSEEFDGDSLLLNDASGFSHPDNLAGLNNDDLPPPVVPTLNGLSLDLRSSTVSTGATVDVIEEIVYDGLELQVHNSEQPSQIDYQDVNVYKNASQPSVVADYTSESGIKGLSVQLPQTPTTSSESPLLVNFSNLSSTSSSSVFPSSVAQLSDRSTITQPLLVTVPSANTNVRFPSSNLTLLPTSLSLFSASSNVPTQRHIAVILPSATVSVNSSTVQLSNAQSSFGGPTFVLKTTGSDVCSNLRLPSVSVSSDAGCAAGFVQEASVNSGLQILKSTIGEDIANFAAVALNNPLDGSSFIATPVTSATGFIIDRPDFTSYVQRVIERVKQEKDEEVTHQRERVKRSKKANLPISVSCVLNISPAPITVMAPPILPSNRLTPIAPMPAVSGSTITLRSPPILSTLTPVDKPMNSLNNVHVSTAAIISSTHPILDSLPESGGIVDAKFVETSKSNSVDHVMCTSNSMALSSTTLSTTNVTTERVLEQQVCCTNVQNPKEIDTVISTIEAVANGEFDETLYQEKIVKGILDRSEVCDCVDSPRISTERHSDARESVSMGSIGFQDEDSEETVASMPSECTTNSPTLSKPTHSSSSTTNELPPARVLALGTTRSPSLSFASAISPGIPGTSCSIPISSSMIPQQQLSVVSKPRDNHVSACPPVTSPVTVSNAQLEQFAAHFANNPLMMEYFSNLLAQKNQTITSATSLASESHNDSFKGNTSQTSFLSQTVLKASQGNNSVDFLTAATMAAMVAMAPLKVVTTSREVLGDTVSVTHTSVSGSTLVSIPHFSLPPVTESHVQCFPLIWHGRLLLKNEEVHVQMHYLNGTRDIFTACMDVIREQQQLPASELSNSTDVERSMSHTSDEGSLPHPLRVAQRMRLDTSQLEGVCRKLRQVSDFCMCLAVASAPSATPEASVCTERARMNQVLRDAFINYLIEKCAAGIINVCHAHTQQNLFVIHIFPPCEFSRSQLQICAPALLNDLSRHSTPHMLIVITTV